MLENSKELLIQTSWLSSPQMSYSFLGCSLTSMISISKAVSKLLWRIFSDYFIAGTPSNYDFSCRIYIFVSNKAYFF